MLDHDSALDLLRAHGQEHVLAFWDKLDAAGRDALLAQVAVQREKRARPGGRRDPAGQVLRFADRMRRFGELHGADSSTGPGPGATRSAARHPG